MSFLKRLFGSKSEVKSKEIPSSDTTNNKSVEVADTPELFAEWVNKYLVLQPTFEDDLKLVPSIDNCSRLKISDEERQLSANEFVLLRTLGACGFVRSNLGEKYYLLFKKALLPEVIERMERHSPQSYDNDIQEALEQYQDDIKSDSDFSFSMTYLDRVYPHTQSAESIIKSGIPTLVGFQESVNALENTREGFCLLKFNMGYESLKAINDIVPFEGED